MAKYKNNLYEIYIINACGEWDEYINEFKKYNIKIINLSFSYYSYLPKTGFIPSRLSYILIFLISFFPLLFCLRKHKAEFFIMHLITSLPLFLMRNFKIKTKFILRISGMPKLNFLRKYYWKKSGKKLFKITCPTKELMFKIEDVNIFEKNKICFLQDAIINLDNFQQSKNLTLNLNTNKKIILSVGRLTKQKNFQYLINEYDKFLKFSDDYDLVILGDGEDRNKLLNLIELLKLQKRVHLIGRVDNVYDYMENSNLFILSSLWEELGFVIVEAAFKNLFIISSNCPNGPSEFIEKNKGGILFESNKENSLSSALKAYLKLENSFKERLNAKRKSHTYTKFKHHLTLHKILRNEN